VLCEMFTYTAGYMPHLSGVLSTLSHAGVMWYSRQTMTPLPQWTGELTSFAQFMTCSQGTYRLSTLTFARTHYFTLVMAATSLMLWRGPSRPRFEAQFLCTTHSLTLLHPLVSYGYSYKASCATLSFVIFDIRAL